MELFIDIYILYKKELEKEYAIQFINIQKLITNIDDGDDDQNNDENNYRDQNNKL